MASFWGTAHPSNSTEVKKKKKEITKISQAFVFMCMLGDQCSSNAGGQSDHVYKHTILCLSDSKD